MAKVNAARAAGVKETRGSGGGAGATLFKVIGLVAVLCMTAWWGAGWALAIYALIIFAMIPTIMLFRRERGASSIPTVDRLPILKGLATLAAILLCMSASCFLLFPLR